MNVKPFVNNYEIWSSFVEHLNDKITRLHVRLETAADIQEVAHLQGRVAMCRELLKLRDTVNGK